MKVIVDTNVFMSGIFWSGPPAKILEAWNDKKIDLILSTDILREYIRVSAALSKKHPEIDIDDILELLVKRSNIYNVPSLKTHACRDPNDDMFIECAIYAGIKLIVSGDADLLAISGYQTIEVLKPRQFFDRYLA